MSKSGIRLIPIVGAPVAGTDEQQTVTITGVPTGGTFALKFEGFISANIAFDAIAAVVQAALEALSSVGSGGVIVAGGAGGPYTVTFTLQRGKIPVESLLALANNLLTGGAAPSVTIVEAVPGVEATQRSSKKGTTLIDLTNAILYQNTSDVPNAPVWDKANAPLSDAGEPGDNVLRVAADVISAETVTINGDIYEVEIVNTDTTDDTQGGDFVPVTNPLVVADYTTNYANSPATVGLLLRIGTEIMCISAVDGADVTLVRGVSGTTIATHADAADMYKGDGVVGDNIAVGLVATLTPVVFIAALVADINNRGTVNITALVPSVTNSMFIYTSVSPGDGVPFGSAESIPTTETLSGVNNVWSVAAVEFGRAAGTREAGFQIHEVTAAEVAVGEHRMIFPFTIGTWLHQVYDSTGLIKADLTSLVTIENDNQIVIDDTGAKVPAAGDFIHVIAWGV